MDPAELLTVRSSSSQARRPSAPAQLIQPRWKVQRCPFSQKAEKSSVCCSRVISLVLRLEAVLRMTEG